VGLALDLVNYLLIVRQCYDADGCMDHLTLKIVPEMTSNVSTWDVKPYTVPLLLFYLLSSFYFQLCCTDAIITVKDKCIQYYDLR